MIILEIQQKVFLKNLILFWALCFAAFVQGQQSNLGSPPIRNFSKKTYSASPQNWKISQRNDGLMLFANNLGLLSFDGKTWQIRPMVNHTIMRSLKVDEGGKIFVGGQGEFGYFDQRSGTSLEYHDLTYLVPEPFRKFADVWSIQIHSGLIFFQTFRQVMIYDGKKITAFPFDESIEKMFIFENRISLQFKSAHFSVYTDNTFTPQVLLQGMKGDVVDICKLNDGRTFIATYKDGIYQYDGNTCRPIDVTASPNMSNIWISSMKVLSDGNLMIGTSNKGVLLITPQLNSLLNLRKENGLQNSTVLTTVQDMNGDLWVATESGLDFIEYKSPYRIVYPDGPFNGTGYSSAIHKGWLYLGTNNGLFYMPLSVNSGSAYFKAVDGSRDVCWNLDVINDQLLLGQNEGASVIVKDKAFPFFRGQGVWKFIPQSDKSIVFGAYEGVGQIMDSKNLKSTRMLKGFAESSRIMVRDGNDLLWMSHPYRGIFKLKVDKEGIAVNSKLYTKAEGLETELENYIILVDQKVYSSNTNGIFSYNFATDKFQHDTTLEKIIGFEKGTKLLLEDTYKNIWFRKGNKMGFLELKDSNWKKVYECNLLPSLPESLAGGFEKVFPLSANEFLFNCESGFLLFDKRKLTKGNKFPTTINKLTLIGEVDAVLMNGIESGFLKYSKKKPLVLGYDQNNLRFEVASNLFSDEPLEYLYVLDGLNEGKTGWTSEPFVTYNNLSSGKYILKVKTKIGGIEQTDSTLFYFEIVPAWYNSNLFRMSMLMIFAFGIIALFQMQNKKFETEKTRITQRHQEVVDEQAVLVAQSEKEIIELKNDQLQKDISFKNTELASIAMHLAHKKDFITTLEQELKNIHKNKLGPTEVASNLKSIIHRLQQESVLDDDWERFTYYFDELHMSFINRLKEKYPDLTTNDHRLCAYLRMNLSTKEIAALSNISPRGVEGSRYRLRKKMDLPNELNLNEFMNEI